VNISSGEKKYYDVNKMINGNFSDSCQFDVIEDGKNSNTTVINFEASEPFGLYGMKFYLAKNVINPEYINITAIINDKQTIVLAKHKYSGSAVEFPSTRSNHWQVTIYHKQPLRIAEITFMQEPADTITNDAIRFIGKPDSQYLIYFNPDRDIKIKTAESGNLATEKNPIQLSSKTLNNSKYKQADIDKDGHPDTDDNCPKIYNPEQVDLNNNSTGDDCEDFDKDGIMNIKDNCDENANAGQLDTDSDGIGDACDNEESRFTEKYKWMPWVGIGFAAFVLITLFALTAKSLKTKS